MWGEQEIGVQGDYGGRRRNTLAEYLMRQGQSDRPVQHWTQALANAGSMVLGAYIDKKDQDQQNAATGAAEKEAQKSFGLGDYLTREPDAPASPAIFGAMTSEAPAAPDGSPYAGAIKSIESGGKYDIVGPTHPKYGRALGAYQVMEANLPEWSKAALGREVSANEFLANPKVQDAVFQDRFGGYVQKYGNPQDAASAWFTGRPLAQGANARDALGTTGQSYVDKFTGALGSDAQPVQQVAQATPSAPSGGGMSPRMVGMMRALQNPNLTPQTRALGMLMLKTEMERAGQDPNESRLRELQVRQAEQNLSTAPLDAEAKRIGVMKGRAELGNMPIEQEGKQLANERQRREIGQIGSTGDIKEYEYAKSQGFQGTLPEYQQQLRKAGAASVTVGGGSDKQVFDAVATSADAARAAATGMNSIREARAAVTGGGIFGAGADARLGLQKIGALVGVADPAKIQNTETFRAAIAPQVAALMKATVGSTQISNADREFAEKAAGGAISLDQGTIARLLDVMERGNAAVLQRHQGILDRVYPNGQTFDRERALFGVDTPGAPQATPQGPVPAALLPPQPAQAAPQAAPQVPDWREVAPGFRFREVK
jgi:hypothetical protein